MAITYSKRDAAGYGGVAHDYKPGFPIISLDQYYNQRHYDRFDLSSYSGVDAVFTGTTADGTIFRTEDVLSSSPPNPTNP